MGELELYGGAEVIEGEVVEEEEELFAAPVGAAPAVRPEGACMFCFARYGSPVVPGEPRYSRRYMAYLTACAACAATVRAFAKELS